MQRRHDQETARGEGAPGRFLARVQGEACVVSPRWRRRQGASLCMRGPGGWAAMMRASARATTQPTNTPPDRSNSLHAVWKLA